MSRWGTRRWGGSGWSRDRVTGGAEHVIAGAVTITLGIAAAFDLDRTHRLAGDVPWTIEVASTFDLDRVHRLAGDVPWTLTPAAAFAFEGSAQLVGDVGWTLTPAAAFDVDRQHRLDGALEWVWTPGAAFAFEGAARIPGDVPWTFVPAAAFDLDREHRLDGALEWVWTPAAGLVVLRAVVEPRYFRDAMAADLAAGAFIDAAVDTDADLSIWMDRIMGFGSRVTHSGGSFDAVLTRAAAAARLWESPALRARSIDVEGLAPGTALVVDGEPWQTAGPHEPDGTGMSIVRLEHQT